jgi:hypothetical protein
MTAKISSIRRGTSVSRSKALGSEQVTRGALVVGGASLLLAGAVAVFVSTNATGTAALVTAGVVLIAIAAYGDRIESVEAGGMKFQLTQAAASQLVAAEKAEAEGNLNEATRLRSEAAQLLKAAQSAAASYEQIRATHGPSWQRTAQLEALVTQQARDLASAFRTREAVQELFDSGKEGNRVLAIVMMHVAPELASSGAIADAVSSPRTAFEQYHALVAAEALADLFPRPVGLDEVRRAVETALATGRLDAQDSDRGQVARRVLSKLSQDQQPPG